MFKQTKAALTEYASISGEQNETRQLIFLITNTQGSGDEFDVIRNSLTSVFRVI